MKWLNIMTSKLTVVALLINRIDVQTNIAKNRN